MTSKEIEYALNKGLNDMEYSGLRCTCASGAGVGVPNDACICASNAGSSPTPCGSASTGGGGGGDCSTRVDDIETPGENECEAVGGQGAR